MGLIKPIESSYSLKMYTEVLVLFEISLQWSECKQSSKVN